LYRERRDFKNEDHALLVIELSLILSLIVNVKKSTWLTLWSNINAQLLEICRYFE